MKGGAEMEYLKEFRKGRNLSQEKMAELLDVSLSLYTKIESENRKPSREFMNKFKTAFPDFDMNIFCADALHAS